MSRKRSRSAKKDADFLPVKESSEEIPENEIEDSSEHGLAEDRGNNFEMATTDLKLRINNRTLHLDFNDYENPVARWLIVKPSENNKGTRKSIPRKGKEGYRDAFRLLADHDIDGFLDHWIIKRLFEPVYILTRSFGQEYGTEKILRLWKRCWANELYIRKLTRSRVTGKCCACRLPRNLRYCFYLRNEDINDNDFDDLDDQSDGDHKLIALMGTDCYEIKFTAMIQVVDVCWQLVDHIDSLDFEQLVPETLEDALQNCNAAPAVMKEKYTAKSGTEINLVDDD